ncbi:MAG: hypothetical protein HYS60_02130 [Candidatus Wildermuthbacteria bacterium]|nr:hypothetical protein [Candidatus Wildermuthbacteria bacterium]
MDHTKLPGSLRKFVRLEKARIRREILDSKDQKQLIEEMYQKIIQQTQKRIARPQESSAVKAEPAEAKK